MHKYAKISKHFTHLSSEHNALTTLPLEVVDQRIFTAEYHHLKVEKFNFSQIFHVSTEMRCRGEVVD